MTEPPQTEEGWYVLHDFRAIDWDAWREAPARDRDTALEEGVAHLESVIDGGDTDGDAGLFAVPGHKADLLVLVLRPTIDALDRVEREFEQTALAGYTDQVDSYLSVTEISGYVSDAYFEDPDQVDAGTRRYMDAKLHPEIPDVDYCSFYPMAKRRGPEHNWYDLPFADRADLMADHGESGRNFAGRVQQVVASSLGLDDWEWSVTLFADDPTDLKDVVYEMRFDDASSKYGEFGRFVVGRRFPPHDLKAYLDGDTVPTDAADGKPAQESEAAGPADADVDSVRSALADLDVYAGTPHGEDVHALALYSTADTETLREEVFDLRESFEHYDTHVKTAVYDPIGDGETAVVSLWETASAADTAAGFLDDLPGIVGRAHDAGDGWGTMGMFYTVKPEYLEDFHDTFAEVQDLLADMDGHRGTTLLANVEDDHDMFIASRWDSREDAMTFFRSDAFADTVAWGRDVLADQPRHVFLA
ncbi:MAG: heme-binding protein [Halobacteriaceae archaeon]